NQPKSNTIRNVLIAAFAIVVLIGGTLGINAFVKSSRYSKAIDTFETAESMYEAASTISDYEDASLLFDEAFVVFDKLGNYKDAPSYTQKCEYMIRECERNITFLTALDLYNQGKWEEALEIFSTLSSASEAIDMAELCRQHIDFEVAIRLFESGDFDGALEIFSTLKQAGFTDAAEWCSKTIYQIADRLYNEGHLYEAFKLFRSIVTYTDAAERSRQCTTPYPDSGALYHNSNYRSSASCLELDGSALNYPCYIKIYSDGELVASVFLRVGDTVYVYLPSGSYMIRNSNGTYWFGEDSKFGDEGIYYTMIFGDGESTTYMAYGYIYTITFNVGEGEVEGEAMEAEIIDRDDF
ncbi:MAG: hypothetical protein FWD45_06770, partial [Coriobacteriia bacterium]|nr:hypothetical protein [Coriobacteriia bacterium]